MSYLFVILLFFSKSESFYVDQIRENPKNVDQILEESEKIYEDSYFLMLYAGYAYLLDKNYQKSEKYYKKAYEIYPDIEAVLGLSFSQLQQEKYSDVLDITSKYKMDDKSNIWIKTRRVFSLLMLKKYNECEKEGEFYIQNDTNDDIKLNLAYCYLHQKKDKKALKLFYQLKKSNYPDKNIDSIIKYLNPKFRWSLIPFGGGVKYSNHPYKDSYNYFGGYFNWNYGLFLGDLAYSQGTIKVLDKTELVQKEVDFGLGYGSKHQFYTHFKNIFDDYSGNIVFLSYTQNQNVWGFGVDFSTSFYSDLKIFQQSIKFYYIPIKGIFLSVNIGNKLSKKNYIPKTPFFEGEISFSLFNKLTLSFNGGYGRSFYFVGQKGFYVDNSGEDEVFYIQPSIKIKMGNLILVPYYLYSQYKLPQNKTFDKSIPGIQIGYSF
ncbi:hypothetical protein JXR93_01530 [bacterium]|nr:hypothetical protein [bacterium]